MTLAENPKVNRCLKDKAFDHIDHALGRPLWPLRDTYRNHFAVDADSAEARDFAASPHWRQSVAWGTMQFFAVTAEGRAALDAHVRDNCPMFGWEVLFGGFSRIVPAATASRARYAYYLAIADCLPDLSFGRFVQQTKVRKAA